MFITPHRCVRLLRFLFGGGSATLLHWAAMATLIHFSIAASTATAVGAALGAIANYLLQFHYTFDGRARHQRAVPRYLVAIAVGWLANLAGFGLLHNFLAVDTALAQGVTSLLLAIASFFLYQRVVFHECTPVVSSAPSHPA